MRSQAGQPLARGTPLDHGILSEQIRADLAALGPQLKCRLQLALAHRQQHCFAAPTDAISNLSRGEKLPTRYQNSMHRSQTSKQLCFLHKIQCIIYLLM